MSHLRGLRSFRIPSNGIIPNTNTHLSPLFVTIHRHHTSPSAVAFKQIKRLQINSHQNADKVINEALTIYGAIELKDCVLINSVLNLLLKNHRASLAPLLWDDIELTFGSKTLSRSVSFHSLTECCIKTYEIDVHRCIKVAKWMQNKPFSLSIDTFILKIISKYKHQIEAIQIIHSALINQHIIIRNERAVKTALINAYSRCNDLENALELFHSIKVKDTVCFNAMMTA